MELENQKQLYKPATDATGKPLNERRRTIMVAMWQRMSDYFGPLWESAYGGVDDQAIYAWTGALAHYSESEIGGAVKACENWDGKFQPTFPEFKSMVMAARSAQAAKPPANPEPVASLEYFTKERRTDSEIAKREKKRMRAIPGSPKSRDPSDADVESFKTSFNNLHLARRMGPL